MPTHITRRAGLGRRVNEIISLTEHTEAHSPRQSLLDGPSVVPFDAVPFAMLVSDPSGEVLAVNESWETFSGLSERESLGTGWLDVLPPEGRSRLRNQLHHVASTGGEGSSEHRWGSGHCQMTRWWLRYYEKSGQKLVGVAVAESAGLRSSEDAARHRSVQRHRRALVTELVGLFENLEALTVTLHQMSVEGHI